MLNPPRNTFPPEHFRAFQWAVDSIRELDRLVGLAGSSAENAGLQLNSSIDQLNRSVAALDETVAAIAQQQTALAAQQATLETTLQRLTNAGQVYINSVGTTWSSGAAGWVSSPPSVTAASMSKRFRVTVTAGASGGTAFVTFSATNYLRDRALGSTPAAIRARGSALGGASEAGTASRSFIVTMPSDGEYTFTAQAYRTDQYVSVIGLEIMVEPIL